MRDECWHPECYMINKVNILFLSEIPQNFYNYCSLIVLECESCIPTTPKHHV
jgi:hypothetical protein